jgi:two-component system, sporulation sensor kinase E
MADKILYFKNELSELRQQIAELKKRETECARALCGNGQNNCPYRNYTSISDDYKKIFKNDGLVLLEIIYDHNQNPVDAEIVYLNPVFANMARIKPDDLLGKRASILGPEFSFMGFDSVMQVANTGELSQKMECLPGQNSCAEVSIFQPQPGLVAIVLKASGAYQEKSEERFRKIVEIANEGIWILDEENRTVFANNKICQMLGCTMDEIMEKGLLGYIDPEWREVEELHLQQNNRSSVEQLEFKFRRKDGSSLWGLVSATPLYDQDGKYTGSLRMITDITERKRTEDALRLSEEKFSKAFNSSPTIMSITTIEDGRYIDVNEKLCRITRREREDIIGRTATELNLWPTPEARDRLKQMVKEYGGVRNLEVSFGKTIGLVSAEAIDIHGEKCMIFNMTDITERKRLEREMMRLDKLNLIGEIAASIAHETRNPMTSIRGFLQILAAKPEYSADAEYFDIMIEEIDRANSIITEFLSLAKNKPLDLQSHNLNQIIETLSPLIFADAMAQDKYISLELQSIPDLVLDQEEIRQLILNLVRNGLEAMSAGGKLVLSTWCEGNHVIMSVKDEGNGIPADHLERIGTPFFSTKEQGTGLGLSVCYSIAARHKAAIEIQTSPSGTEFRVRFKGLYSQS